jgi:hypothetical protein
MMIMNFFSIIQPNKIIFVRSYIGKACRYRRTQYYNKYRKGNRYIIPYFDFFLSKIKEWYYFVYFYKFYLLLGEAAKHEFQSETRMLLNIVAKSLYSDKEVVLQTLTNLNYMHTQILLLNFL